MEMSTIFISFVTTKLSFFHFVRWVKCHNNSLSFSKTVHPVWKINKIVLELWPCDMKENGQIRNFMAICSNTFVLLSSDYWRGEVTAIQLIRSQPPLLFVI